MDSRIYAGAVTHRRSSPVGNEFRYSDTMLYLDLQELEESHNPALMACSRRFFRSDHFGDPKVNLQECVRELVENETGDRPHGPVRLLTHVRQMGYVMNPVSFFYVWSTDGSRVETIVAEVQNTPWNETHCYVLACHKGESMKFRFAKQFHVSPFMGMNQEYVWRFGDPAEELNVHMENWQEGTLLFEARLSLQAKPLTLANLRRLLWIRPLTTLAVTARIYFQAARLWKKGCPYHPHPSKSKEDAQQA